MRLDARCLLPGHATGELVWTETPLSFWGGVDTRTGEIIDRHHPLSGTVVAGKVFALPGGRGSCSGSLALLELIGHGMAPAALVFEHDEAILTLGAMVGEEVFGSSIPVVSVGPAFSRLRDAGQVTVTETGVFDGDPAEPAPPGSGPPPPVTGDRLELTETDRQMLSGAEGRAREVAMRIIVRIATVQGAASLVDVHQAHIDGCFYTGPAGLRFAEQLRDWGGVVKVPATTNASSVDVHRWRAQGVDPQFGEQSLRVVEAYVGMGATPSLTCAPYLLATAPRAGQQIAWGESNAVAYANSVLGARTMKYPDLLDVCVALTGRGPYVDSHLDAGRRATVRIDAPPVAGIDDAFYPTLGYLVGSLAGPDIPVVTGLESSDPSADDLKAFSAAFATTASAPMFYLVGVTPEASTIDQATGGRAPARTMVVGDDDLRRTWRELSPPTAAPVDLVALGSPHFSLTELELTAQLTRGRTRHLDVAVTITCGRAVYDAAVQSGAMAELHRFGATVLTDTCWCHITEPVIAAGASTILTNSAKYAHYGPALTGRTVHLASLRGCIDAACTAAAPVDLPPWLALT